MVLPNGSKSFVEKLRIVIRNQPIAISRLLRFLRQGEGSGYRESGTEGFFICCFGAQGSLPDQQYHQLFWTMDTVSQRLLDIRRFRWAGDQ